MDKIKSFVNEISNDFANQEDTEDKLQPVVNRISNIFNEALSNRVSIQTTKIHNENNVYGVQYYMLSITIKYKKDVNIEAYIEFNKDGKIAVSWKIKDEIKCSSFFNDNQSRNNLKASDYHKLGVKYCVLNSYKDINEQLEYMIYNIIKITHNYSNTLKSTLLYKKYFSTIYTRLKGYSKDELNLYLNVDDGQYLKEYKENLFKNPEFTDKYCEKISIGCVFKEDNNLKYCNKDESYAKYTNLRVSTYKVTRKDNRICLVDEDRDITWEIDDDSTEDDKDRVLNNFINNVLKDAKDAINDYMKYKYRLIDTNVEVAENIKEILEARLGKDGLDGDNFSIEREPNKLVTRYKLGNKLYRHELELHGDNKLVYRRKIFSLKCGLILVSNISISNNLLNKGIEDITEENRTMDDLSKSMYRELLRELDNKPEDIEDKKLWYLY